MVQDKSKKFKRMKVFGRVQMVLFRDSAKRRARSLGLIGYVKNLPYGSVEIVAGGDEEKVRSLFEWAKRGPVFARVDRFELDEVTPNKEFSDFEIIY